jgi:hypothetical protein
MKRKIGVAVSAMIVASQIGSPLWAVPPTLDQLNVMATYLENNDVAALRAFLQENPELLEGDTTLAILLREFMINTRSLSAFFAFEPDLRDAIRSGEPLEEGSDSY